MIFEVCKYGVMITIINPNFLKRFFIAKFIL